MAAWPIIKSSAQYMVNECWLKGVNSSVTILIFQIAGVCVNDFDYDAVVVGAGPAGAVCSLVLARNGVNVCLLEKNRIPHDRACGDALMPDSIALLKNIEIWDEVEPLMHKTRGVRVYAPSGLPTDIAGNIYTCKRKVFDECLVKQSIFNGADLKDGFNVSNIEVEDDRVTVTGPANEEAVSKISCRLVILATGGSSKALEDFKIKHRSKPSAYALRQYVTVTDMPDSGIINIWYDRSVLPGYAWAFPVSDNELNFGAGIFVGNNKSPPDLKKIYDNFLTACEPARYIYEKAVSTTRIQGAPIRASLEGSAFYGNRTLLIGEAVGTTYAMTGEGIGKAMESAVIAADYAVRSLESDKLDEESLGGYEVEVKKAMASKFKHYKKAQNWMRYPVILDLLAKRANSTPEVLKLLEEILAEKVDPTKLLSVKGLVTRLVFSR